MSVAVEIHESAAGSPSWLITPKPGRLGHIGESSVAVIAIKRVLPEIAAKNIVKAIIVVVSDADSTGPSKRTQPCFFCDIGKCPVPVILVQSIGRAFGSATQARAAQKKQIHPPIIVVINEGAAASGGLHDVFFDFCVAVDHRRMQARASSDVHEMGVEGASGSCGFWQGFGGVGRNTLRSQPVST